MNNSWLPLCRAVLGGIAVVAVCLSPASAADEDSVEVVHFPTASGQSHLLDLPGYLRRPAGDGPFAAVVLLHGCGGDAAGLDHNWGARLQSWGYVSLTVDSFTPRGITNSCHTGAPTGRTFDAYGALQFLAEQPFVNASRVALMGFSEGGIITLFDVEPQQAEGFGAERFRAAIALYPICSESGIVTVPTLVLNGQLDDWSSADACRKMVEQESDIGVTRHKASTAPLKLVVLPGASHKFDDPKFQPGRRYMGHFLEYNPAALTLAANEIHNFLLDQLGR